jgi:ABC-type multidrug transport system fused ATPase/permease subunit
MSGAERIFEILDIDPDIKDRDGSKPMPKIKGMSPSGTLPLDTMKGSKC